jgi:hypothetical protein
MAKEISTLERVLSEESPGDVALGALFHFDLTDEAAIEHRRKVLGC